MTSIADFDQTYLKRILVRHTAEDSLAIKLQEVSMNEHYARLYGPNLLVAQNHVQDILEDSSKTTETAIQDGAVANTAVVASGSGNEGGLGERKLSRKFSRFLSKTSNNQESMDEYELEREALLQSFADNSYMKFASKKFAIEDEDRVEEELEKMREKRTKVLWKVAMSAAKKSNTSEDAIEKSNESSTDDLDQDVQDKIKKAYDESKPEK